MLETPGDEYPSGIRIIQDIELFWIGALFVAIDRDRMFESEIGQN